VPPRLACAARGAAGVAAIATVVALRAAHRAVIQEVHVPETISVADLAHKMSVKAPRSSSS
jgi:hypothetical protein